jgi:hypothetical protein
VPISEFIRAKVRAGLAFATPKNSQLAAARRVALKMGRRRRLLVGYVSIQICALLPPVRLGPPCRRPFFERNDMPSKYETVHSFDAHFRLLSSCEIVSFQVEHLY